MILVSGAIGIAWRHFRRQPLTDISWRELYLFGMVIHLAMLGLMLTLPWETALQVLSKITLPVILLYPLGTAVLGILMVNRLQRERVDDALRESEEKFKAIFESANVGKSFTSPTGEITVNKAFCDLLGYTPEELRNKTWQELTPPDEIEANQKILNLILKGERDSARLNKRYLNKSGSCIWADVSVAIQRDPEGNPLNFITTIVDITERKKVEDALRETNDYLDKLIDYANAPIIVWDPQLRIIRFNHAFEDLTDLRAEEVLGRGIDLLFPENRREECFRYVRQTMVRGELFEVAEIPILHRDGSVSTILWNSAAIHGPDGKTIIATIAQGQDITERKRAEEQVLRQSRVLAAINSVFFETLTADSEEAVSGTCLKVAQEITGSKFGFLGRITPECLYTATALSDPGWEACRMPEAKLKDMVIRGIWGQVILKEQSLIVNDPASYPDRVGIPEGHPPLTSFLGVPLRDQDKVIGMIAVANRESGYTAEHQYDMETICVAFVEAIRRKKAEKEIIKLNTELEQRVIDRTAELETANKELEAFAYSVSHDLRAPLRSIDGFSQALLEEYQDKPIDDTGRNFLERVRKATQHMGLLIDDMLKLSRINKADMKRESVDLSGMIREISEAHQKSNPDRAFDAAVQEGIVVQGDPYLIKIAMENLVDNAFKFTGNEAHPRIEFGTTAMDGETACFIRDNGAGFDMAYVDKLFGAFQRLHTTEEFPGTGIGLATVQRIIHRHGRRIWAEGETGKGATFYFTIV